MVPIYFRSACLSKLRVRNTSHFIGVLPAVVPALREVNPYRSWLLPRGVMDGVDSRVEEIATLRSQ